MKKTIVALSFVLAMAGLASAQNSDTRARTTAANSTSASKQGRQINLASDTQLAAQLENSLDARHAKPGDRVALKTVKAIKQNGETIVPKGAQLLGRVTDVQKQTRGTGESHIRILFDRLRTGSTETPITATILSITGASNQTRANTNTFESDTMASSSSSARISAPAASSRGGGGLLGGVGNTTTSTVGNVAGTTTNAVGSTVGATTSTVGNTTGNLGRTLRGLQITQSSSASAEGGSTLSLTGGNLHLDSGTTFNLSVSNSTSAGNNP